jgi:hypothetical protein
MSDLLLLVVYFFVCILLVTVLPCLFLLFRYFVIKKYPFFFDAAKNLLVNHDLSVYRESLTLSAAAADAVAAADAANALQVTRSETDQLETELNTQSKYISESDIVILYLQRGIREGWSYWGLSDCLYPDGVIMNSSWFTLKCPPGLAEDFLFYCCNNIMPISFLFSDINHPDSVAARTISFVTAQSFSLAVFVAYYYSSGDEKFWAVQGMALSSIFCQWWIMKMLFCPCIQEKQAVSSGGDASFQSKCGKYLRFFVRCLGGICVIPVVIIMLILILWIATSLAYDYVEPAAVGFYFLEVVFLALGCDTFLSMVMFLSKAPQVSLTVFSKPILQINTWQTRRDFVNMSKPLLQSLSLEEQNQIFQSRRVQLEILCCCCSSICRQKPLSLERLEGRGQEPSDRINVNENSSSTTLNNSDIEMSY